MAIKEEDLKIVSCLRQNSRDTLTKISRKTNIPVSTIFDRLKHKTLNLIRKNTCLIDFSRIGYNTRAKVVFKIKPEDRDSMKDFFLKHNNVNSLFKINNGFDYMIDVVFKNMKELEYFLEQVDSTFTVKTRQVYYVIDEIESEKFLSDPKTSNLIFGSGSESIF